MSAEELARRAADAMWAADGASRGLGMRIVAIGPGVAELAMPVRDDMTNGHGMCHGGFIFSLADSAFAFACNSQNKVAVAYHCAITFVTSGKRGETLRARAQERSSAGRNGVYDVTVWGEDGRVVAEFQGLSRQTGGNLVEEQP